MYIQRKIHKVVKDHIKRKEYTIITGARQSGKTSLLTALYNELRRNEKLVTYISFEDREILTAINEHPENVFSFAARPEKTTLDQKTPKKVVYLFIDEVQYAKDPANFLKYLF